MMTTYEGWEIAQFSHGGEPDENGNAQDGMAPSCGSTWYRRPGGEWIRSERGMMHLRERLRPREVAMSIGDAIRIMGYYAFRVRGSNGIWKVVRADNTAEVLMVGEVDEIDAWIRQHPNCPPSF